MNVEYVQFHPTTLLHRAERRLLVTEALRGEGARLVNVTREPFMQRYDPRADLAPRDIVTRAILAEMLKTDHDCVYLDAASYVKNLEQHFPTVHKGCLQLGIDITKDPIPVVPAAHYFCGGVLTDNTGRTTLERLYAAGECACTGIHGAQPAGQHLAPGMRVVGLERGPRHRQAGRTQGGPGTPAHGQHPGLGEPGFESQRGPRR